MWFDLLYEDVRWYSCNMWFWGGLGVSMDPRLVRPLRGTSTRFTGSCKSKMADGVETN